ncbi:hypothetical protein DFH28DRAFT_933729 [Melampsora americana]|nr:hypothetical protein DFH28DRAFT_933729 [Melampsora americana]
MANIDNICFQPNVELSLLGKAHPNKQLKDKAFTKKHWDSCAKAYNLDFLTADGGTEEEDNTDDGEDNSSIDLVDSDEEEEEGKDEDEEDETDLEDEDGWIASKGKGKEQAKGNKTTESEQTTKNETTEKSKGKGELCVEDEDMEEAEEEV